MKITSRVFAMGALIGALSLYSTSAAENAGKDAPKPKKSTKAKVTIPFYPSLGSIERLDPALDSLIAPDTQIEKLAEGFDWSEGPIWLKNEKALLFSDVPRNQVLKWKEGVGLSEFLKPSGYTGKIPRGGEPGSNGLTLDPQGRLVLCQHGDRRIARLEKDGSFKTLAEYYNFLRFNSPNDLAYKSNGELYFTDPPYGLIGNVNDPAKEISYSGVYRLSKDGKVTLLTRALTFPNGIAFSPDEKTLYVAVSDKDNPVIVAFPVLNNGMLDTGKILFNAKDLAATGAKGLPDGLKVDIKGNLWATGPGGVLIISPEGKHLGTIKTGEATANCNWGDDGSTLFITADMYLLRVKTLTKGNRF